MSHWIMIMKLEFGLLASVRPWSFIFKTWVTGILSLYRFGVSQKMDKTFN